MSLKMPVHISVHCVCVSFLTLMSFWEQRCYSHLHGDTFVMCGAIFKIYFMHVCPSTGERLIKAREGILSGREDDQSIDALKAKFNDYCPGPMVPYEENPFFTCVERAGLCPHVSDIKLQRLIICQSIRSFVDNYSDNIFFFKPNVLCSKSRNLPFPSSQILILLFLYSYIIISFILIFIFKVVTLQQQVKSIQNVTRKAGRKLEEALVILCFTMSCEALTHKVQSAAV